MTHIPLSELDIEYRNPEYQNIQIRKNKALDRAKVFFDGNLPKVESFHGLEAFDQKQLEKDIVYIHKLEGLNKNNLDEEKQWSVIQEAIILNEMEMSDWFGPKFRTIRPTNHADYVQQIDGIVEIGNEKVAFDATYKKDPYNKIHKIKDGVDSGELNPVTYFYDDKTEEKSSINIPSIILGFNRQNLEDISEYWLYSQEGIPGSKKKMAEHPIQMLLIYQALMQFSTYELHARNNLHDEELSKKFADFKERMLELYNSKNQDEKLKKFELDSFTETLISEVSREYKISTADIKGNIWEKKEPKKIIKLPRNTQSEFRAAA